MSGETTSVRVALRIRPLSAKETSSGYQDVVRQVAGAPQVSVPGKDFTFDHVFGQRSTQGDVYAQAVRLLVDSFFEGYNATVLAYGQVPPFCSQLVALLFLLSRSQIDRIGQDVHDGLVV